MDLYDWDRQTVRRVRGIDMLCANYKRRASIHAPRNDWYQQLSYFSVIICRMAPVSRL